MSFRHKTKQRTVNKLWAAAWQNNKMTGAPSEDSDQPEHPPSLTRIFAVRMKKAWVLSYLLSAQRRLHRLDGCPGWSESSLDAQVILLVLSCCSSWLVYRFVVLRLPYCSGHGVNWAASSEFGIYRLCEQRRFRRACASAQSRQNLRYSLIQAVSQEEPSDRKPDPWPLWMAGHAQLKFVMKEFSKTQIRLTRPNWSFSFNVRLH